MGAPSRNKYRVVLDGLESVQISADLTELADNRCAGNISNGWVARRGAELTVLRISLSDGYVEAIFSGTAEISQLDGS